MSQPCCPRSTLSDGLRTHLEVTSTLPDQLIVGAILFDPPVFENVDSVRVSDGRQSVRDRKGCASDRHSIDRPLDKGFGLVVEGRCSLIELIGKDGIESVMR
jgi:hypothetical protein